jgi:hypothetical protein
VINGPTIEAGESLSDAIDLSAGRIVRLTTPAGWTGANLTFQVSSDGFGYNDLYDGDELVHVPCGPSRAVVINNPAFVESIAFLKIRSGTAANPVPQEERREFAVAIKTEAAP